MSNDNTNRKIEKMEDVIEKADWLKQPHYRALFEAYHDHPAVEPVLFRFLRGFDQSRGWSDSDGASVAGLLLGLVLRLDATPKRLRRKIEKEMRRLVWKADVFDVADPEHVEQQGPTAIDHANRKHEVAEPEAKPVSSEARAEKRQRLEAAGLSPDVAKAAVDYLHGVEPDERRQRISDYIDGLAELLSNPDAPHDQQTLAADTIADLLDSHTDDLAAKLQANRSQIIDALLAQGFTPPEVEALSLTDEQVNDITETASAFDEPAFA